MKKLLVLALVLGSLMLTGCAAHLMTVSNNNLNQTETILTQKNFKVVGQAEGKAVVTYICGIGGLSKKAIRANAIAELHKAANLKGSQTIVNISVKETLGGVVPFWVKHYYTATGTIIEFTE